MLSHANVLKLIGVQEVRNEWLNTRAGNGHLRIRIGYLPGISAESPVSAVFLTYFIQVLTGEFPFRGTGKVELGWSVVHGLPPDKPENASSAFLIRCWISSNGARMVTWN